MVYISKLSNNITSFYTQEPYSVEVRGENIKYDCNYEVCFLRVTCGLLLHIYHLSGVSRCYSARVQGGGTAAGRRRGGGSFGNTRAFTTFSYRIYKEYRIKNPGVTTFQSMVSSTLFQCSVLEIRPFCGNNCKLWVNQYDLHFTVKTLFAFIRI